MNLLKKFLQDPKDNNQSLQISMKLVDVKPVSGKLSALHEDPFLLLTHGGIKAVESLVLRDKNVKFPI